MVLKLGTTVCALVVIYSAVSTGAVGCGFGYEILTARMEHLETQSVQQQSEISKLSDCIDRSVNQLVKSIEESISKQEKMFEQRFKTVEQSILRRIELMVNRLDKSVDGKLKQLSSNFSRVAIENSDRVEGRKVEVNKQIEQSEVSSMLISMKEAVSANFSTVVDDLKLIKSRVKASSARSCLDEPTKKSGQYWLQPFVGEDSFDGYCEQQKFGGGWIVIQRRFDGTVDFYRNWAEYKAGFGTVDGEFWLGLEMLHRLTRGKNHTLIVEVEAFDGKYGYALYDGFEIGSETEDYSLKKLGSFSGSAGDSLVENKGARFSTKDRDHDKNSKGNCATDWKGGWWFTDCGSSNLNGRYVKRYTIDSMGWYELHGAYKTLKMTRMMIKEVLQVILPKDYVFKFN